ncbi:MAG: hypothetical protein ACFB4I_06795 [Cyanophyceae cyanobacterium]
MNRFYLTALRGIGMISFVGLAIALGLEPVLAQTFPNSDSTEVQRNEYDPNSNSSLGTLNPTDLIHRANLSRSRNLQEFSEDSQINLGNAAEEYKRLQQERLQQTTTPDN